MKPSFRNVDFTLRRRPRLCVAMKVTEFAEERNTQCVFALLSCTTESTHESTRFLSVKELVGSSTAPGHVSLFQFFR